MAKKKEAMKATMQKYEAAKKKADVGNTLSYDKYRHFIRGKSFIRAMTCSITGDAIVSIRRSKLG